MLEFSSIDTNKFQYIETQLKFSTFDSRPCLVFQFNKMTKECSIVFRTHEAKVRGQKDLNLLMLDLQEFIEELQLLKEEIQNEIY